MPLIELTPPPGVEKPGTIYDAKGKWYNTLWVRWFEGIMQAIGGFEAVNLSGTQIDHGERVSGTWAWKDNSGNYLLAYGGPTTITVLRENATYDVTPVSGFTTGSGEAAITTGNYDQGNYDQGNYGVGDELISSLTEAQSYAMDNYGEDLVFVAQSDGKIYYMDSDGDAGNPAAATVITPSAGTVPVSNVGVVVTPERFLVALGADGDGRKLHWADQDDHTDWDTTSTTNQVGTLFLPGKGAIMAGRRSQAETLIWTETDLFSLRYQGGAFIYSAVPVGAVGAISRRCMAVVGSVAYWMSNRGFHIYNGFTQSIPSPVSDFVFSDLNRNQASKIWAEVRQEFGEIIWHYPSATSTECNKSVTYNYEDGFWQNNTLARTAGEDRGALPYPVAFGATTQATQVLTGTGNFSNTETITIDSKVYTMQTSLTDVDGNVKIGSDLEESLSNLTAAINLGAGAGTAYATSMTAHPTVTAPLNDATTMTVEAIEGGSNQNTIATTETAANASWGAATMSGGVGALLWRHEIGSSYGGDVPEATSGPVEIGRGDNVMHIQSLIPDEKTLGDVDLYLLTSFYPTATETTNGPFTPTNPTDLRLTARQVRLKVVQDQDGWRLGTLRVDVELGGER